MDEPFYSAELTQQFELFDAEYAYSNATQQEDLSFSDEENAECLDSSAEVHSVIVEAKGNVSIREEDERQLMTSWLMVAVLLVQQVHRVLSYLDVRLCLLHG